MKKMIRKKLALMLANLKKKRLFYTEVEFLESDSTAYIDTGVSGGNNNLKIEMGFSYSKFYAYGYLFSNYESEQHNTTRFVLDASNNSRGLAYINTKSQNGAIYTPYNLTMNNKHSLVLTKTTVSIDGVTTTNSNPPVGTANTKNIILFNRGAGTYYEKRDIGMRCYYFRIYDNDVLVRDFIPVLDWDMTPCMYDKVSGQLFYNAGTGDFSYGREIHYVDYLESTGTQYIDTGYVPSNTTGVEVKHTICANNGIDNILFGCRQDSNDTRFWEDVDWGMSDTIGWGFNTYSSVGSSYRYQLTTDMVGQTITSSLNFMNDRACKINGVSYDPNPRTTTLTTITRPIYLFGANNQGSFGYANACKIFTAQISNGQTLVRDFIPAIDENDTYFMFDRVSHTCYNNAGSGSFIGPTVAKDGNGKIIENEYE